MSTSDCAQIATESRIEEQVEAGSPEHRHADATDAREQPPEPAAGGTTRRQPSLLDDLEAESEAEAISSARGLGLGLLIVAAVAVWIVAVCLWCAVERAAR